MPMMTDQSEGCRIVYRPTCSRGFIEAVYPTLDHLLRVYSVKKNFICIFFTSKYRQNVEWRSSLRLRQLLLQVLCMCRVLTHIVTSCVRLATPSLVKPTGNLYGTSQYQHRRHYYHLKHAQPGSKPGKKC